MNIPSRVNPFGYDNTVPPGYMRLEFLESTGTQYIALSDIQTGEDFGIDYTFLNTSGQNWALNLQTGGTVYYRVDVRSFATGTVGVHWGTYANSKWFNVGTESKECKVVANYKNDKRLLIAGLQTYEGELNTPNTVKDGFCLFAMTGYTAEGDMFKDTNVKIKIKHFAASKGQVDVVCLLPSLDPSGIPCMYDMVTGQPFRNNGTGQFIAGFTMAQAEDLGSTIPDNTTLTVSFPWEASLVQHNSRVEYSLEQARDKGCTLSVRYREPEKDSAIYNKYAECKTVDDIFAVNPTQYGFRDDVTIDGTWMYPLPNLERVSTGWDGSLFGNNSYNTGTGTHPGTKVKKLILSLPKCTYCHGLVQMSPILEHLDIDLPICTFIRYLARSSGTKLTYCRLNAPMATTVYTVASYTGKLKEIEVSTPKVITAQEYFYRAYSLETVTCPEGNFDNVTTAQMMYRECRALKDFPLSYPSLKTAGSMFDGCQITGAQTIAILNSIPTWTDGASHPITMGIHIDHQNDEEVVAAITAAEEKGWTVTVQWNGTPTAQTVSTFGLRRPPIYAKLSSVEHPDGTIENFLDWGHYVSNAEENGYQEFASKEEAYEHFNLEMETEE